MLRYFNLLDDIHIDECRENILLCGGKDWVAKAKCSKIEREAMDKKIVGEKALVELCDGIPSVVTID